jgi:thioredoxin-related protein
MDQLTDVTKKFSVVVVMTEGCPWCKRMHSQTVPLLNAMGIRVMLTKSQEVKKRYSISAFPALIYIEKQNPVYIEEGFVAPSRVVEVMSKINKGEYPDNESELMDKKADNASLAEKVEEFMRQRGIEPPTEYRAEDIPDPWEEDPE